jgi:hypothetical protein
MAAGVAAESDEIHPQRAGTLVRGMAEFFATRVPDCGEKSFHFLQRHWKF